MRSIALTPCFSVASTCDDGLVRYLANRVAASDDVINELSSILGAEATAIQVYNSLAASNGANSTAKGMEDFTMALNVISEGYFKACYVPNDQKVAVANASDLLDIFLEVLDNGSDHTAIRNLYGTLLCLKIFESGAPDLETCAAETNSTGLYNCLDPDSRKCIFQLDSECSGEEMDSISVSPVDCLGFAVDTSGSMESEIDEVKNVIKSFIQAEENRYTLCYVLVPFNDYNYRTPYEVNSE